ncbi:MAG: ribonuclease Z [Fervidicoccaceae archaeon]
MSEGYVLFLGTSAGAPLPSEGMPAILMSFRGWKILLDAGEGAQLELLRAGVGPARLDSIHVTHAHGDHVFGLPGLLQSMSMSSRSRPLILQGPEAVRSLLEASFVNTGFEPSYSVRFASCNEPVIFEDSGALLEVSCFRTCHVSESYGYAVSGYRKKREGLSRVFKVSYTGDTSPCPDYFRHVEGSDVLIHDATFSWLDREIAHRYGHSTARDAALVAEETNSKMLVLFHRSTRYRGREWLLLSEALAIHREVFLAKRGLKIIL